MLTSLYVHIPFCDHICTYCDFHKSLATEKKKSNYIQALLQELEYRKKDLGSIKTIYIGGGTPLSLTEELLEQLLLTIQKVVNLDLVEEYTIETNPNNLTREKITLLQTYGLNRVSIGIQTFDPDQLSYLGRDHSVTDIEQGIRLLREANFPNISVDMIFSLVDQTMTDLEQDINQVLALDVNHISFYSLILEEKTLLYHDYKNGLIQLNEEDLEADMFELVMERLQEAGYHQYEISNFAKPGYESQHNKAYWLNEQYLGVGSGSHSHQDGTRFYHIANVSAYIENIMNGDMSYYHTEAVNDCADRLLVGLRLTKGVSLEDYKNDCGSDIIDRFPMVQTHIENQLLEIKDGYLRLTKTGIRLGNIVFMTFLEGL
jgi:oxygen-independent coproporphyrinogen-3 oxidase